MRFARWVFLLAGLYGLVVMPPQYFLEGPVGRDQPPPITHPEFFYGFIGVTLAWQVVFLIIASDPVRYRPLMLASVLEKVSFGFAVPVLFWLGRVAAILLPFAALDLTLAVLFIAAYRLTPATWSKPS